MFSFTRLFIFLESLCHSMYWFFFGIIPLLFLFFTSCLLLSALLPFLLQGSFAFQSRVRGWLCQRVFLRKMRSIGILQRYWRGAILALKTRETFIYTVRAAIVLQSAWRGRQARKMAREAFTAIVNCQVREFLCLTLYGPNSFFLSFFGT